MLLYVLKISIKYNEKMQENINKCKNLEYIEKKKIIIKIKRKSYK